MKARNEVLHVGSCRRCGAFLGANKLHRDIFAGCIVVMEPIVTLLYQFGNGIALLWQESLRNKISRPERYANVHNDIAKEADLPM